RMFTRPDMGWLWFIPLSDTVISVGAVIPQVVHRRESKATPEESLTHYLASTPAALPLLERARRVSPARFDADYSYLATRAAGAPLPSSVDAVLSVAAGNWRPSVTTRALVELFFAVVAVKRVLMRIGRS